MTVKLSSVALGAVVVVLSGFASYMGARLAQPIDLAVDGDDGADADLQAQVEEVQRDVANLKRQVDAIQEIAVAARDLAEGLRDRQTQPGAAGGAAVAGAAGPDAGPPKPGVQPGEVPVDPDQALTDDERRAARKQRIQDTVRRDVRALVPAMLASYADTKPGAEAGRRHAATIEAKQLAVALAVTPEQADKLGEIFEGQADRLAREVGPLVKDGLDRADPDAVEAGLTRVWDDMDRQAKEILGEEHFVKFGETTVFLRTVIRDVLADAKKRR